ncbi:MAG: hypothetical protein FE047_01610 [Thermoplasmata archaeon]|nr:MAG: hypothetical protein FE047_01610 [Thermoplasmata archaeon]KAA0014862.1 MAG: hypothetical protein FE041_01595 [Thermoplasmata archaeon]
MIEMKKKYIALALVGVIACAVLVEVNGIGIEDGKEFGRKLGKWFHKMMQERRHHVIENYLNTTRIEGILEYIDGVYYIEGTPLYLGNDWFMDTIARSDYDGDGEYEYVWQELEDLVGSEIVVNGVLRNGTLCVSHINGIWLRMPRMAEITEIEGILEKINGSYYVNDVQLIIKRGFSKSDIDRDGALERMTEELNSLVGSTVSIDGILNNGRMVVMHINGIWAR